jgi:actin-like ATPase involved in cell morphogenesis
VTVIGFDFGTTNSLVSVIVGGRPVSFLQDGQPIPSVVCYEGGSTIVGREARERQSEAGLGIKGNVVRSPKTLLGKESVFVEGVARSPVDIVSDVVNYVIHAARQDPRARDLGELRDVVVTIPVNMVGYRRSALRDAFRKAGLRIRQFVHEPLAALYAYLRTQGDMRELARRYDRQLLLVVDWGGGTLDITLCRMVDGVLYQVANDGTEQVGGDEFDETLRRAVVDRVTGNRRLPEGVSPTPDGMTRLLHRAERAKIELSTRESVAVYVRSFFRDLADTDLEDLLSRSDLETLVGPLISQGLNRVTSLLDRAGVVPAQVALCLAVGGMSNMPAIRSRLHEWFGAQRVHVSDRSASLIAEGAAWIAHDERHLHLAKNVELLLARNSRLTLLPAGTEMPLEGEVRSETFHLYCVDPRDAVAKFQIEAPLKAGQVIAPGDPRMPLCSLALKVDEKARPFRERLEMDIRVDENLVLTAICRSLNRKDIVNGEIHDLEFSLRLPVDGELQGRQPPGAADADQDFSVSSHSVGDLTVRSNVANREDDFMVPGELLYTYSPFYFDRQMRPPEVQDEERLYYEPCAMCGRASNDPLCQCGSKIHEWNSQSRPS